MSFPTDFPVKVFSLRYLDNEDDKKYLNGFEIDLEKERNYFFQTKDDEGLYHLYRVAYEIYYKISSHNQLIYSFYGFVLSENSNFLQQAKIMIRKLKIEHLYE